MSLRHVFSTHFINTNPTKSLTVTTCSQVGGSQASGPTLERPDAKARSRLEISRRLSFCHRTDRPRAFSLAFDEAFQLSAHFDTKKK